jgi:hypothetical protein
MDECEHLTLVFVEVIGIGDYHYLYKCKDCDYQVWVDAPHNNFLSDKWSPR